MEYSHKQVPMEPKEDDNNTEKRPMDEVLDRVTKLALETIEQLSSKKSNSQ
ncbi:hypothetical protein [Photobacterium alginatilyticum]|uniref:hypothetical protein n=1 Tax=Photobacterium alginatilyticum TaxID=1775171 RepID=UPI00136EE50E|nr:hypothetical protein [Photobacterium alginatilyticum]